MPSATGVLVIAVHPVIAGVVRLACEAADDLELIAAIDDPDAGVAAAATSESDVIVLDLDLRGTDVLELLRRLRSAAEPAAILALSDRAEGAVALDALRGGVDGFLVKADGLRTVGDAIRRVAVGERVIDPKAERAAAAHLPTFARQARESSGAGTSVTKRERQVLRYLAEGLTMRQIASRLNISPRTVETHVEKLYRKLGVRTRVQAVRRGAALHLIALD
jgi:two-component system, NarL family, nitrate/nitrite response regulator NarL